MRLFHAIIVAAVLMANVAGAQTRTLRIVTYNIQADIGVTNKQPTFTNLVTSAAEGPPLPGLIAPPTNSTAVLSGGVLEGIGEENVGNDSAQPLDILALEETTSNPTTVAPIVKGLDAFYGVAGMYASSSYQATEQYGDPTVGNGPNAVIYNAKTVQLLASVPVDPPGGSYYLGSAYGEYREVMRYEFAPAGVAPNASNIFYIYVSHYKSGSNSSDLTSRLGEAKIIRNDEANNLPASARVLYVGDYNITASSEASYQAILSNAAPNGVQQGQGIDPMNVTGSPNIDWGAYTTTQSILAMETESATYLRYRDDLEVMTTNIYSGAPGGFTFTPATYHVFGNNGTVYYQNSVNSGYDTALNNDLVTNGPVFINAAQLYVDLTGASDHLPVVADYTIPLPAPVITGFNLAGTNLVFIVANSITNGLYTVWTTTNLVLPFSQWTTLATNVSGGSSFNLTVTNAVNNGAPQSFYLLQTK
jgi:hypothetical protein